MFKYLGMCICGTGSCSTAIIWSNMSRREDHHPCLLKPCIHQTKARAVRKCVHT
uniref:Uncharacterized protein n=1 Tax=Arundo donax TaxID=35708 RepID=A0A0A9D7S3_ARUDO